MAPGQWNGKNFGGSHTGNGKKQKTGHYFNNGLESSGEVHVLDIGFKPLSKPHRYIQIIEHKDVVSLLPEYAKNIHKYNRGKLICIAGSEGYTGAGILAVKAAYKRAIELGKK